MLFVICRVVNIVATAMFGVAGVSAATRVMTVCCDFVAQMLKKSTKSTISSTSKHAEMAFLYCFDHQNFVFIGPLDCYSFGTLNLSVHQHAAPLKLQTPD